MRMIIVTERFVITVTEKSKSVFFFFFFLFSQSLEGKVQNLAEVGKTASESMLALFESRYTLKGRYNIGNVGKTASESMLALFESIYTLNNQPVNKTLCRSRGNSDSAFTVFIYSSSREI